MPAHGAEAAESGTFRVMSVRCHRRSAPLLRPFVTAARRTEAVAYIQAEVEISARGAVTQGAVARGQGTAAEALAVTGESLQDMASALEGPLAGACRGAEGSILDFSSLIATAMPGAFSAKAALEVAVHDAWSRSLGLPLVEALGGEVSGSMEQDMTISLEDPATMARRAAEAAARGTRILKVKLGRDAVVDRVRLHAVAGAAPGARLRLDANQGWSVPEAIAILTSLAEDGLPIDLVEQPVPAADLEGMATVRAESPVPIMADESVRSPEDARRVVDAQAADMLNIKLAKAGGIHPALEIADIALAAGIPCMVGAMMEPRVSIAAAAHLAFAHPAITMIDLDSPDWFAGPAPSGGYVVEDGRLCLHRGMGLGMDILAC